MYIQITNKCNFSCEHCCMSCTGKGSFMKQEVFDKCLDFAKRYNMDVTLGGGEPTLHPKIIDWAMQAAFATVDFTLEMEYPAVLVVTNGSITDKAIQLAKLAHLGMIAAEVSRDIWHDEIDEEVVNEFTRYNAPENRFKFEGKKGHAGIRNVEGGVKAQGRAKENGLADTEGCACSTMFIAPNGDFYKCGCRKTKLGNIMDINKLPEAITEDPEECEKYLEHAFA